MDTILDLFATGGVGAIVGTIGNWLTMQEQRKTLIINNAHQHKMAEFNSQQVLLQDESKRETILTQGNVEVKNVEALSFKESLKGAAIKTGVSIVDGIRGLMRPLITIFLLVMTALLASSVHDIVDGLDSLPQESLLKLYRDMIIQLLFLTSTAVTWWFGSRPPKKQ
jgi:hypothetical protein